MTDGSARVLRHLGVVGFLAIAVVLASCERTPSKSDYVSAQVTALCEGQIGNELRACRIAVIKQFQDMPLEEMKRRFPPPEPRSRPSCGF
ncbi:MAG: hypothetical protein NXI30_24105 [bacterium]|nr:hypothetical protein [bacterium]